MSQEKQVNPDEVEIDLSEDEQHQSPEKQNRPSVTNQNSALKMSQEQVDRPNEDIFEGAGNDFGTSDQQAPANVDEKHEGFHDEGTSKFEKHFLFRPCCVNLRRTISFLGALAGLLNQVLDIVYAYKIEYILKMVYIVTCTALVLRFLMTLAIGSYYYNMYVVNYKTALGRAGEEKTIKEEKIEDEVEVDELGKSATSRREQLIINDGQSLYASLYLLYYTGFYRVLPSYDFNKEIKNGFTIELFLSLLPMFFCQVFNNSASKGQLDSLQRAALIMKFISFILMVIELSMLIWENR